MTLAAVLLVLTSAALHVTWNLRSRRERPTAAWFALSLLASWACMTPLLLVFRAHVGEAVARAWPALLATAVFSTVYNTALAGAYRRADLSLVYPLARATAPALVAVVSLALGRGDAIGWGVWLGVPAIVAGSMLLPLGHVADLGADLRRGLYRDRAFVLAVVSACATAGYTLCDDLGVRAARAGTGLDPLRGGLLYAALHAQATAAGMLLAVAATARGRAELVHAWRFRLGAAAGVGLLSYASYACVLVAMSLVADVAYVAAFRQVGVPLSVAAGVLWLHERVGPLRLAGAAVATAGLVLVAWR